MIIQAICQGQHGHYMIIDLFHEFTTSASISEIWYTAQALEQKDIFTINHRVYFHIHSTSQLTMDGSDIITNNEMLQELEDSQ